MTHWFSGTEVCISGTLVLPITIANISSILIIVSPEIDKKKNNPQISGHLI